MLSLAIHLAPERTPKSGLLWHIAIVCATNASTAEPGNQARRLRALGPAALAEVCHIALMHNKAGFAVMAPTPHRGLLAVPAVKGLSLANHGTGV